MDFPIIINWMSPLSFLGVLGVFFFFYSFFYEIPQSKQKTPDGTPRSAASHLGLFCLSRGVSRRTPGIPGFNVIFSSIVFPRVFLRKNYEKQVILTEKRCCASTLHISWIRPCCLCPGLNELSVELGHLYIVVFKIY